MNEEYIRQTKAIAERMKQIKHKIGIMSGKGGVGKSAVCAILGAHLAKSGMQVGILDGDITGPSMPKILGVKKHLMAGENGIIPAKSALGLKLVSMNLLLDDERRAVIWRGPLIGGAIRQLLADTDWGGLDYLLVDMPPGTADAPLTLVQSVRLDGVLLVSTPQELVEIIVSKAMDMLQQTNTRMLGVVMNMASYRCPHCGNTVYPFGNVKDRNFGQESGIPLIGTIPIDEKIARLCDAGKIEEYTTPETQELVNAFLNAVEQGKQG